MITGLVLLITVCVVSAAENSLQPRLERASFSDFECGIDRIPLQALTCEPCFHHQTWEQRNQQIELHKIWRRPQLGRRSSVRIKGGRDATVGEFPWTVLINSSYGRECSGSLLSRRLVLTAAHCFWNHRPNEDYKVWVGADPPQRDHLIELEGEEVIFHPCEVNTCYDRDPFVYDIALVILKPFTIQKTSSHYRFNTVCYPKENRIFDDFDVFKYSGWGLMPDFDQSGRLVYPQTLQWSHVAYKGILGYSPGHSILFHAYWDIGACEGDSGAPVVMQNCDGRYFQVAMMTNAPQHPGDSGCGSRGIMALNLLHPYVSSWIMEVGKNLTDTTLA